MSYPVNILNGFLEMWKGKKSFYGYLEELDTSERENLLLRQYDLTRNFLVEGLFTAQFEFQQRNAEFKAMSKEEKQLLATYNDWK